MAGVEFLLALLQLALLLGDLLLENHLHLCLHLGKLLFVQGALLLLLDGRVDLLEDGGVLSNTHASELLGSIIFVQGVVGVFLELFHVGSDEHLAQLHEIAVLLVVNLNETPGVLASSDLTTIGAGDLRVGTDNSEGDLRHDLIVLCDRLVIVEFISRTLEDLNVVVLDIGENLWELAQEIYIATRNSP